MNDTITIPVCEYLGGAGPLAGSSNCDFGFCSKAERASAVRCDASIFASCQNHHRHKRHKRQQEIVQQGVYNSSAYKQ